jgi:two-component system CitB family sensor kinase
VRYSTRVLLLQLLTVIAVVAVCAGIFSWLAREQLKDEAMTSAVSIARSVAESPGCPGGRRRRAGRRRRRHRRYRQ